MATESPSLKANAFWSNYDDFQHQIISAKVLVEVEAELGNTIFLDPSGSEIT